MLARTAVADKTVAENTVAEISADAAVAKAAKKLEWLPKVDVIAIDAAVAENDYLQEDGGKSGTSGNNSDVEDDGSSLAESSIVGDSIASPGCNSAAELERVQLIRLAF